MNFKPMLTSNEQPNLDEIRYPLLASTKLDGCRMIAYQGKLITRSLKPVQNWQLQTKFNAIKLYTENNNIILDGEIYAEGIPFQFIVSCFMTHDYFAKSAIKKWDKLCTEYNVDLTREEVLDRLKFYVFDCVSNENLDIEFYLRNILLHQIAKEFPDLIVPVEQRTVNSANEVGVMFESVLNRGYEGLMLKDPQGRYKCGRTTIKENLSFKVKPYVTMDAKIIGVKQATVVDPNAPKTINELGRSVTSKKKGDRIPISRAAEFTVIYEDKKVDVGIGGTEAERNEIWANKESYIGRWIEYKGLKIGMKDVPRHCNMCRYREDKDV